VKVAPQHNIVIEGRDLSGAAKERYETTMNGMVQGLGATRIGKILLHFIKNSGTQRDWVLIAPYSTKFHARHTACNALAWDDLWPVMIGTTEVMATRVNFSPETYAKAPCHSGPSATPFEVLVHELVHAQRHISRIARHKELKGSMDGYGNEEEFFAVVFTNVWSSAHARTSVGADGLLANHGSARMPAAQEDSEVFMANRDHYFLVKKYCEQQSELTRQVALVDVKFNPFHTYYAWKAKNKVIR